MRSTRIVRFVDEENDGTRYQIFGQFLTEKIKRDIRRLGVKTASNTWMDVFKDSDMVYRWNSAKNKYDIYIGNITAARYASGKRKSLSGNAGSYADDLTFLMQSVTASSRIKGNRYFVVATDRVSDSL